MEAKLAISIFFIFGYVGGFKQLAESAWDWKFQGLIYETNLQTFFKTTSHFKIC